MSPQKRNLILFSLMTAFTWWVFLNPNEKTKQLPPVSVNQVQNESEDAGNSTINPKDNSENVEDGVEPEPGFATESLEEVKISASDYFALYQDWRLALDCEALRVIELLPRSEEFNSQSLSEPAYDLSELQFEVLTEYASDCFALDKAYVALSDAFNHDRFPLKSLNHVLFARLLVQKVEPEYKGLKEAIVLHDQFDSTLRRMTVNNYRKSSLPENEQAQLQQQIDDLESQLNEFNERNVSDDDPQVMAVYTAFINLSETFELSMVEDHGAKAADALSLQQGYELLINKAKDAQGDELLVYLEVLLSSLDQVDGFERIYNLDKNFGVVLDGVNTRLRLSSGVWSKRYLNHILAPTWLLYLCDNGLDCGADSGLVRSRCLGIYQFADDGGRHNEKICGYDLKQYYLHSGILSSGQIKDIEVLLAHVPEVFQ